MWGISPLWLYRPATFHLRTLTALFWGQRKSFTLLYYLLLLLQRKWSITLLCRVNISLSYTPHPILKIDVGRKHHCLREETGQPGCILTEGGTLVQTHVSKKTHPTSFRCLLLLREEWTMRGQQWTTCLGLWETATVAHCRPRVWERPFHQVTTFKKQNGFRYCGQTKIESHLRVTPLSPWKTCTQDICSQRMRFVSGNGAQH